MPRRHELAEYEAFVSGETAQVVARDDRPGEIVFLPRGRAAETRPTATAHYSCPIPDCTAPRPLSTRGGSKRDHFFHRTPHSHPGGRESLHHLQAKHLLAAWARRAAGDVEVVVNEEEWSSDARRRPDVMVTWPAGRRVALEVEYKAFAVDAWRAKEEALLAAGITPVWLFGHAPNRYLRQETRRDGARQPDDPGWRLVPLTEAVAAAGHPVLFINPVEEKIGTLWRRGVPLEEARNERAWWLLSRVGEFRDPVPDRQLTFELALCGLDECTLHPIAGMRTPMLDEITADRERVALAAEQDKAALAERRRAQHAQWDAEREQRRRERLAAPLAANLAATGYVCSRCWRPLDPSLASAGKHILC